MEHISTKQITKIVGEEVNVALLQIISQNQSISGESKTTKTFGYLTDNLRKCISYLKKTDIRHDVTIYYFKNSFC